MPDPWLLGAGTLSACLLCDGHIGADPGGTPRLWAASLVHPLSGLSSAGAGSSLLAEAGACPNSVSSQEVSAGLPRSEGLLSLVESLQDASLLCSVTIKSFIKFSLLVPDALALAGTFSRGPLPGELWHHAGHRGRVGVMPGGSGACLTVR